MRNNAGKSGVAVEKFLEAGFDIFSLFLFLFLFLFFIFYFYFYFRGTLG